MSFPGIYHPGTPELSDPLIFTVEGSGAQVLLEWVYGAHSNVGKVAVDWGDGTVETVSLGVEFLEHEYQSAGVFTASVRMPLEVPDLSLFIYSDQITRVDDWGSAPFKGLIGQMAALTAVPNYLPSSVRTVSMLFYRAFAFNQDISSWDVSNVTDMHGMFDSASAFNQDISSWDVSNVTNMQGMFYGATAFNQDLSPWCVQQFSEEPHEFANITTNWTLPKPNWGAPC